MPSFLRHRVARIAAFLAVAAVLPLAVPISGPDLALLDRQFALLRSLGPAPIAPDVVVVGIDEATTTRLREPLTLWHRHLGAFLAAMSGAGATVVGLDLNLPDRSFDFLLPGYDQSLSAGLLALRSRVPVVLGVTIDAAGRTRSIYPPFLSLAGPEGSGYTLWRLDPDRVVRAFDERIAEDGGAVPTLVGQMFRRMRSSSASGESRHRLPAGLIDYTLGPRFDYVPLHEVLDLVGEGDAAGLRERFAGRPVLLGSVLPFVDRHYQPVNLAGWEENAGFAPGVLIHAQALRSLIADRMISPVGALPLVTLALAAALAGARCRSWPAATAVTIGGVVGLALVSTGLLALGHQLPITVASGVLAAAALGRAGVETGTQLVERGRLRRAFAGAVSPAVLEEILAGRLRETERVSVCVLFSDIRGFTSRAEAMVPEEVVAFLNAYFEEMVTAIHDAGGTLDKFLGDGIMAFFGAPNRVERPCDAGLAAAQEMLVRVDRFNAARRERGLAPVKMGVGLHFGEVVVGHVGSRTRREYTAVGDVVNTASRLEGLTKEQGIPVVVSEAVHDALSEDARSRVIFEPLGTLPIRGRSPLSLWGWGRSHWAQPEPLAAGGGR